MLFAMLVTAALFGPPASFTVDQWRDEYQATLLATAERGKPSADEAVPRLVALYVSLVHADALPRGERTRMRQTLQSRLARQLEVLLREKRKHDLARQHLSARHGTVASPAGGGAMAFASQQLIDLIVTTIAPDSWKQNGGKASIAFYARNPALVIRQTGERHGETAELLRALRD
jgi:hypothetical protein